jgi:3-deoxy-manno-octulosonate cytidylyltransferase (CMP-KDO synthetase)
MIEHVYRRVAAAPSVDRVLVATDDPRIVEAVEAFGGGVQLTRRDHASGSDRIAEVAAGLDSDVIVNVQGDEPLLEVSMVEQVIASLAEDPAVEMATLRCRIVDPAELSDPNVVKVVVDRDGRALYFSRWPIPYVRSSRVPGLLHAEVAFYKHIGLYAYRRQFLLAFAALEPTPLEQAESLEQLRALEHGYRIRTALSARGSVGVDTIEDLERVRRILAGGARA